MLCDKCNHGMREVDHINSGNAMFTTFQCTHCMNRTTKCSGLSTI